MKEIKSIDDLKPARYNPRRIKGKAETGLKRSLQEFGDISGIVWNQKTGNLISGHQRIEQLKTIGIKIKDNEIHAGNGDIFKVRIVDWSLEKEKAANVAANNKYISGQFTEDVETIIEDIRKSFDDEIIESLNLDDILNETKFLGSSQKGIDEIIDEIDLGDGEIQEKEEMKKMVCFVPLSSYGKTRKKLLELVKEANGTLLK